jgi:hypothetical protein
MAVLADWRRGFGARKIVSSRANSSVHIQPGDLFLFSGIIKILKIALIFLSQGPPDPRQAMGCFSK